MPKYTVTIKYGDPGKPKQATQNITVEASSEESAERLAVNKFRASGTAYATKEVDVIKVKAI